MNPITSYCYIREENYTTWIKVLIGYGIGVAGQTKHLPSNYKIS